MGGKNPFVTVDEPNAGLGSGSGFPSNTPKFDTSDWNLMDYIRNFHMNSQYYLYWGQRFLEDNGWYVVLLAIVLYQAYGYMEKWMQSMYAKRSLQIATSAPRRAQYEEDIKKARQRQVEQQSQENRLKKQSKKLKELELSDGGSLKKSQEEQQNTTPKNKKITTKEKKKRSPELTFRAKGNEYNPLLGHGGSSGYRPSGFARPSGGG